MSNSLQIKNMAYAVEAMARVPDLYVQYTKGKDLLDALLDEEKEQRRAVNNTPEQIEPITTDDIPF